jgi:hypothetical protein
MGKAPKTRMDEDFHILQTETDARKSTLERLSTTSQAYLKAISKYRYRRTHESTTFNG